MDLFEERIENKREEKLSSSAVLKPLSAQNRPQSWDELVGQEKHLAPGRPLREMIEKRKLSSMIIWGPPGTGKSSFSKLILKTFSDHLCFELLATETGVGEIKKIIQDLIHKHQTGILVVDEFHRFTKLQQDVFLRSVEEGQIVLIGMTTENPKYFLNRALLSRLQIVEFKQLPVESLKVILARAWSRGADFVPYIKNALTEELFEQIIKISEGDARLANNFLEKVLKNTPHILELSTEQVDPLLKSLDLDKPQKSLDPELHYRWISDFIKAMRRGDETEALDRLKKMIAQGEDPLFIGRRMIIFAAEDVGLASPTLQTYIQSIFEGVKTVGLPEGQILLTAATLACCRARKSREAAEL